MKAILAVSFGTSFKETRERTIEAIENDLKNAFPNRVFYRAFTSNFIIKKIKSAEGIQIDNVSEAMERMIKDGITDVIIQPTHLINGTEYHSLTETVNSYKDRFSSLNLGTPLMNDYEDIRALCGVIEEIFCDIKDDEVLALMGHGSENINPNPYEILNGILKNNFCIGTVEFEPNFKPVAEKINKIKPKKVFLTPLLIVAGDHALNDMEGLWKPQIESMGIPTECIVKGMGEYKIFRELYIKKAKEI